MGSKPYCVQIILDSRIISVRLIGTIISSYQVALFFDAFHSLRLSSPQTQRLTFRHSKMKLLERLTAYHFCVDDWEQFEELYIQWNTWNTVASTNVNCTI